MLYKLYIDRIVLFLVKNLSLNITLSDSKFSAELKLYVLYAFFRADSESDYRFACTPSVFEKIWVF